MLPQMTVLAKRVQSYCLYIWMPYEGDVNEDSVAVCAVCVCMRTILDVFPETQGLLDFRGVFKSTVLY